MEKDSLVVPLGEHSFSMAQKRKIYFYPKGAIKNLGIKQIFFYRLKPISAITHYAMVEGHVLAADSLLSFRDKMLTFKDPAKEAAAFKLLEVVSLKEPVPWVNGNPSLQTRIYASSSTVFKSKTVANLFRAR